MGAVRSKVDIDIPSVEDFDNQSDQAAFLEELFNKLFSFQAAVADPLAKHRYNRDVLISQRIAALRYRRRSSRLLFLVEGPISDGSELTVANGVLKVKGDPVSARTLILHDHHT